MAERLLRVDAPHFVAGMVWQKEQGEWRCVACAPILGYMRNWRPEQVKAYLLKKRWNWEWI